MKMYLKFKPINNTFACKMIFFIVAFYMGLWSVRIPTIKDQVDSDYLGVGYIILAYACGSIILMIFSNKIIKLISSRKVIEYGGYGHAFVWILVPFILNIYYFMLVAFIAGCFLGSYEIAMNLQASDIEKKNDRPMMSGFHAFYSLGLLLGATVTGIFIQLNISFLFNIVVVILILLPFNIYFSRLLGKDSRKKTVKINKQNIFFIWPPILFILVILTMTDSFAEGSVDSWSALYMRDKILAEGFAISLATIFFNIFMVIGRFNGDKLRDLLGVFNLLLFLIIFSIIGLFIIFNFNTVVTSILGFSLLGIGVSNIIPLAYSISGKIKGIESAVGISIISISVYGVFMVAPALLGLLANIFGINYVFLPIIFLFFACLLILIFSKKKFV